MKIFVQAKPAARKELIEKIDDTHYKVSVKEPPVKGLANAAIRRVLADYFSVSAGKVSLISGFSSKTKIFEIFR